MKNTLKIIVLIVAFMGVDYALTYPYELSYNGTKDVKLMENSAAFSSLDTIINLPEFKDNILFIRVGYAFEGERLVPNRSKFENTLSFDADGKPYIVYSKRNPNAYQMNALSKMKDDYESKVKMIYLTLPPYFKSNETQKDGLRKWKAFIKKHSVKGHHLRLSKTLYETLRDSRHKVIVRDLYLFPYNIIVDKRGNIVDDNAPSPIFEKEALHKKLDSIIKL